MATLNSTTLAADLSATALAAALSSASHVSVGDLLVIDREAMQVVRFAPNQTTPILWRGYARTVACTHASGATVYIAKANQVYDVDPVGLVTSPNPDPVPWINLRTGNRWEPSGDIWVNTAWNVSPTDVPGDPVFAGDPLFSGDPVFSGDPAFSGNPTLTGSPVFSAGTPAFTAAPSGVPFASQGVLTENGAATSYTLTVPIPAGATLLDVMVIPRVLWNGTSATLKVGDTADDDGFFTGVNLKATDLLVGEVLSIKESSLWGGKEGAYLVAASGRRGPASSNFGLYYAAGSNLTFIVTPGAADGSAGRTQCVVTYSVGKILTQVVV